MNKNHQHRNQEDYILVMDNIITTLTENQHARLDLAESYAREVMGYKEYITAEFFEDAIACGKMGLTMKVIKALTLFYANDHNGFSVIIKKEV